MLQLLTRLLTLFFSLDFIIVEEKPTFCAETRYNVIIIIAFPGAFPSCLKAFYQSAGWCTIIYMKMSVICKDNRHCYQAYTVFNDSSMTRNFQVQTIHVQKIEVQVFYNKCTRLLENKNKPN